ncbi:C-type lectin domain family 4 member M-like [Carassius carassius]|uniref:C-type lectin domain family 4 member M-like n=1 Tax=Carassius carassius TaxID=217509 RepID=UPI00286953D2|nr:C-type lectin domain family 4 member M-like [Carassius carassius]
MESENIYIRKNVNRSGPRAQRRHQTDGNAGKCRGSRCLVLITVCFQIICVLLLINNILLHITIRAERDLMKSYKSKVEELQENYTDLMTEKLQSNFSSLRQKNLETKVRNLTEEKNQLKRDFNEVGSVSFFLSTELKSWSESRQYCRDHGADLIIIKSEEKQRLITSLTKERLWIGLSDTEQEGIMKWVDNSTLNKG